MQKITYIAYSTLAALFLLGCGGTNSSQGTALKFTSSEANTTIEGTSSLFNVQVTGANNITYSIAGGDDAEKFQINEQDGSLSFKTAPDFENPTDADNDNTYKVTVKAEDAKGHIVTQPVTITISDDPSDNGPAFISPDHATVQENELLNFTVNANGAVKFSVQGGKDKNKFKIDPDTGKIDFLNFIPDFEHPSDADHHNDYTIVLKATDDSNHSNLQNFTVTVTDDESDDTNPDQQRHVYKTGADDGITPGAVFGDERNFPEETINNDHIVTVGDRKWEDSEHSANTHVSYGEALNYCNNLNYAGITDWRVPNRHELFEIVNYGKNPTLDDVFNHKDNGIYWSSQAIVNYNGNTIDNHAFAVSFSDGAPYSENMDDDMLVRCVSGKRYENINNIQKDEDTGIYTDDTTGLQWAKDADNQTWTDAKKRCEDLNISNRTDWRLPNISELHSIMPVYNEQFLIRDGDGTIRGPFWTSTSIGTDKARYIANYWDPNWTLEIGRDVLNDDSAPKTEGDTSGSICVRGGHL